MKTPILLHIPIPCHENWDAMTEANKGRHCQSCNKIVVDFSVMSDRQVLEYFKTTTGKTCGRFNDDQLQRPLVEPQTKPSKWNYFIASILGFIMSGKLAAQNRMMLGKVVGKPALHRNITKGETAAPRESVGAIKLVGDIAIIDTVKTIGDTVHQKTVNKLPDFEDKLLEKINNPNVVENISEKSVRIRLGGVSSINYSHFESTFFKGHIVDEKNNSIGGATIKLKGTKLRVSSDINGAFEMKKLGENNKLTLVIYSIGFETKEIEVTPKDLKGDLNIVLKRSDKEILDEVIITNCYSTPITKSVSGKILDEKGNSIGGATIKLKGTRLGTSSGVDGVFEMKKLGENNKLTLVVSSIGFETKEIEVIPKDLKVDLNIVLKTDTKPNADLSSIVLPHQHAYSSCSFLGNVVDKRNNPIPNTTICVKHTKLNTICDANGMFKFEHLRVPLKIILVISSIGYETKEIEIEPREIKDNLNIVLKEKKNELGEIIIESGTTIKCTKISGGVSYVRCLRPQKTIKDTTIKKIQKIFNRESIKIYPNPATKNDIIHITIKDAGEYALHFFDTQSRLLTVKAIATNTNNQTTEFQLPSTVAAGTYFIRILNEKTQKQVTEKIIVQ